MADEYIPNTEPTRKRPILLKNGRRFMREKLQGKGFVVPSLVTVGSIFCGFVAIISAFKGGPHYFEAATKYIAMAIIFDGLDGRIARRLNATSLFGMEFDSLSDVVSFGVAPAVLVYSWAFASTYDELGLLVGFLFVVCGATRLARFNVSASAQPNKWFVGLPIPGAAAAIAAIVYCFPEPITHPAAAAFMLAYMLLIGLLMVSTLPFLSVKSLKISRGNPAVNLFILAIAIGLLWKFNRAMLLLGTTLYALSGLAGYLWRKAAPESYERRLARFRKTVTGDSSGSV